MIEPVRKLTIRLPIALHQLVLQAAEREFSKPSDFARRQLAKAVMTVRKRRIEEQHDND